LEPIDQGRGKQMDVDPTRASSVQAAPANEFDNLVMRDWSRLVHLFVVLQELLAATTVANEQFAVNKLVAAYLTER
jgi:hypothetical protein